MKQNTAILPLAEYNRLMELERKVKEGKVLVVVDRDEYSPHYWTTSKYYTESEVADELAKRVTQLQETNEKLKEYKSEADYIRSLTWREFRKMKKK